jgi:hypothetical protein
MEVKILYGLESGRPAAEDAVVNADKEKKYN